MDSVRWFKDRGFFSITGGQLESLSPDDAKKAGLLIIMQGIFDPAPLVERFEFDRASLTDEQLDAINWATSQGFLDPIFAKPLEVAADLGK
jgi:hypothetical protein